MHFSDVLDEFLNYLVTLEFDTEPNYDKIRKMFRDALIKAKHPLDGKIDFTSPKKPKKVGRNSSPVKRKASKISSLSSDEESFEQTKPSTKTRRKSPAKKVLMKDQSCQTSPAFVKAAKKRKTAAAKASSSKASANPEMEDFEKLAINSAKMATAKSPKAKPKKALDESNGVDNPTPAMSALKAKKATSKTPKRTTKSPPAKPKKALNESQGVDNPTPAMLALMAKTKKK